MELSIAFPCVIVIIQAASEDMMNADTTKFSIIMSVTALAPPIITLFLSILSFVLRRKYNKKDKEISANVAHIMEKELHFQFPHFDPMQEYNNILNLCEKKASALQNVINKYTINK